MLATVQARLVTCGRRETASNQVSQASGEPRQRNMEGCRGSQGVGSVQLQRAVHPSHHSTLALANRGFKETRASHDMCVECLCRGSWLLYVSDAV